MLDFLHRFVQVYLNDIVIFSKTLKNKYLHIWQLLKYLQKAELQANVDNCKYYIQKTKFLSFIISIRNIQIHPQKVNTILN